MSSTPPGRRNWLWWVLYPGTWLFAWILLTVLGPLRGSGRRNVPRSGGVLILANHLSDLDPIAIHAVSPRPVSFMAKEELFHMGLLGPLIRWYDAFPVKRGAPDRAAIRRAVETLKGGGVVCVFPEGRLSKTGELLPLEAGAMLIARMADVPIVCCRVDGTQRVMPYGLSIPRPAFHWMKVRFGSPRRIEEGGSVEAMMEWVKNELSPSS